MSAFLSTAGLRRAGRAERLRASLPGCPVTGVAMIGTSNSDRTGNVTALDDEIAPPKARERRSCPGRLAVANIIEMKPRDQRGSAPMTTRRDDQTSRKQERQVRKVMALRWRLFAALPILPEVAHRDARQLE